MQLTRRVVGGRILEAQSSRAHVLPIIGVVALTWLFVASCGVHDISGPGTLSTLTISPKSRTLTANGTQQFTAAGADFSGVDVSVTPSWSVVGGGSISTSGLFTAGTTPTAYPDTVVATSAGLSSSAMVIVTVGPLASIVITANVPSLAVGATQQFAAVGSDAYGNDVAITPVWSVANGGGSIDAVTGLFTASTTAGTFINSITATSGAISATASVTVTATVPVPDTVTVPGPDTATVPPPVVALATITVTPGPVTLGINAIQQFTAVGRDASSNVVTITPFWSVVAGGGSIDAATGLFTAGSASGTFANTVTATSGTIAGAATITVNAGALAAVTVTPNLVTLQPGAAHQFTAIGTDASGNVTAMTPVWSVTAGGGSIDANTGLFTAGTTAGTFSATVVATSGTTSGTATVIVTTGILASITVTPNPASSAIGITQQFTAVGKDVGGNVVAITPVWSVVAGGGSIDASTGLFTAGTTAGTFTNTVTATSGATSSTVTVIVTAGPLAAITVAPSPVSMGIGATQQFTAVGKDAGGNIIPITSVWTVTNSGGTIDAVTGLFTAGTISGAFSNTVTATSGTTSGAATVNVSAGALASITLTPSSANIQVNGGQQFTAVGNDATGNVVSITPSWSVVAGGGSIDASTGIFTAGTVAGTFTNTVTATSGAISRTATVNVTAGSLATITIAPNPVSLVISTTQQFTAIGKDAGNNVVSITPVWSIIAAGGGIDASTGLFTAGTTAGTFTNTVAATIGTIQGAATVNVVAGALASIDVTPNPASVQAYSTQQFSATGKDAGGNAVAITPVWSVVNGGGSIGAATGLYTAGTISGTFTNTVSVTDGGISRTVTVTVTPTPPAPIVSLGTAALNGAMAGANVSCLGSGIIDADVSTSTVTPLGGFPPCVITGTQHLNDAAAAQGQSDLAIAYNALVGLACTTVIGTADIGGSTRATGVYCSGSSIGVTGALTLDGAGDPNATFVFQAGSTLTTAGNVILINGAQAKNVYWQVGSSATIGIGSAWQGNIIALTSITLNDNATLTGRALARNGSVALSNGNVVTLP